MDHMAEHVMWKKLGLFIPDEILDQIEAETATDIGQRIQQVEKWMLKNGEVMHEWIKEKCGNRDITEHLQEHLRSLSISTEALERISSDKEKVYLAGRLLLNRMRENPQGPLHDIKLSDLKISICSGNVDSGFEGSKKHEAHDTTKIEKGGTDDIEVFHARKSDQQSPPPPQRQQTIDSDLKIYEFPLVTFQETEAFQRVTTLLSAQDASKVVHIYGTPGNGKSQIVRSVCRKLDIQDNTVICHVQCVESKDTVKFAWQNLVKKLASGNGGAFLSVGSRDMVLQDLEEDNAKSFIVALQNVGKPVCLVLEDIAAEDRKLVRDAITYVLRGLPSEQPKNAIKFLIATHKQNSIFASDEVLPMNDYRLEKIDGFTLQEAKEFLLKDMFQHQNKVEHALKLASELAYSPLRLALAKSYCRKFEMPYEEYCSSLGENADIVEKEKEISEENPELGAAHGYEVIMKAIKKVLGAPQMEVLRMASLLWNQDIPDFLLGAFMRELRDFPETSGVSKDVESRWVKCMIVELESVGIVTVFQRPDDMKYGSAYISTHMDILHAVRMAMQPTERVEALKLAFTSMLKLARKDNRIKSDSHALFSLMNHINQLILRGSGLLKANYDIKNPNFEDFQIQVGLSWLYDVLGFLQSEHVGPDDTYFQQSLNCLWGIACSYTGLEKFIAFFKKKNADRLLEYALGKVPSTVAAEAYKRIKSASGKIPENLISNLYTECFHIDNASLADIKRYLGTENAIPWGEMDAKLAKGQHLSEAELDLLREHKMLLTSKQLRKVFLTECIASVLHSRSRQLHSLKNSISAEEQERYEWYSDFGIELCKCMSKDTKIRTTFEYIILANGRLPRLVQSRPHETDEQFVQRLQAARDSAKQLMEVDGNHYEKGIFKQLSGTPYSLLNVRKWIVKANTKMYKRPEVARENPVADALADCDAVYQLAKENTRFVVASNVMVHAAKYYAAVKNFTKAFEALEDAFNYDGGLVTKIEKRQNAFAWATYNYGRAIWAWGRHTDEGQLKKAKFENRCDLILRYENVSEELRKLLLECKEKLVTLEFQTT